MTRGTIFSGHGWFKNRKLARLKYMRWPVADAVEAEHLLSNAKENLQEVIGIADGFYRCGCFQFEFGMLLVDCMRV